MTHRKLIFGLIAIVTMLLSCSNDKKKEIICWGDSLTAPHANKGIKGKVKSMLNYNLSYPEYLQNILSSDYQIINAGVGGENTLTIMARQGAYPMKLAHDVVIFRSQEREFQTFLGNNDIEALVSTYNDKKVTPLVQYGFDDDSPAQINPCRINDKVFELSSESKFWKACGRQNEGVGVLKTYGKHYEC